MANKHYISLIDERFPNEGGVSPTRQFLVKMSTCNFDNDPSSAGSLPVRLLSSKRRFRRFKQLEMLTGISPLKELIPSLNMQPKQSTQFLRDIVAEAVVFQVWHPEKTQVANGGRQAAHLSIRMKVKLYNSLMPVDVHM